MQVVWRDHCIEEPIAACRRSDLDLPEFSFDLPELAASRVKTMISNLRKDGQDDCAILGRKTLEKPFEITAPRSRGGKGNLPGSQYNQMDM